MKKLVIIFSVLFAAFCNSGCSSDDNSVSDSEVEIYKYEESPKTLEGTWHLAKIAGGDAPERQIPAGDVTVTFNPNHTVQVVNRSKTKEMKLFMDSGFYSYEIIGTDTNKYDGTVYTTIDLNSKRCTYWFNDGMMTLDYGMAYDAPGYFFKKLISSN